MDDSITEHINRLHHRAFTIDAHFDLAYDVANRRDRGQKNVLETHHLEGFKTGSFNLVVSSVFINDYFLPEMGLRKALDQISYIYQEIDASKSDICLCRTADDLLKLETDGRIGILLSLEGADPLQNDINLLHIFYALGVRAVGLTWSRRNYAGDGSSFHARPTGRKGGLTGFGIELLRTAEALGMVVDVSHINDEGFWDVMELASKPVIASHSNCRALMDSMRNLTDSQIKALAEKGGVIGMNALNAFIGDKGTDQKRLTAPDLVRHIDHIVQLTGIGHVGLGFDFCDKLENYLQMPSQLESYDVINGHQDLQSLTNSLICRGYSDEDILMILGGNFKRVFTEIL